MNIAEHSAKCTAINPLHQVPRPGPEREDKRLGKNYKENSGGYIDYCNIVKTEFVEQFLRNID
jgi:hypothetical protein